MITRIAQLLIERKGPNAPAEWLQMVSQSARRLEESLFRAATSFEEYRDTSTLEPRLRALAAAKLEAKRLREQQQKRNAGEEIAT